MRRIRRTGLQRRARNLAGVALRKGARARAGVALRRANLSGAKIHLGCGQNRFDGWVNIDIDRSVRPDVRVDLRGGFPAPPGSAVSIFSEHVFEHLTLDDGCRLMADCHAVLAEGGVMRLAMPDLRYLVDRYLGDWKNQSWLQESWYSMIDSAARMLNFALRSWDHLYVYDLDELTLRLKQAGFSTVVPQVPGESVHPEFRGLEQRPDSLLIVEVTK